MALKLKDRTKGSLKKVMIYGLDGSGKSTFAEQYCHENGLNPVVIDIDDTNYTHLPILDLDLDSDVKTIKSIQEAIKEIRKSEYDTIILDGVTSLLEKLTSNKPGMACYSDRAKRWNNILNLLSASKKHLIFIGQIDMEVIYTDEYQSSKAVMHVNYLVNEKYKTYVEKGQYKHEVVKIRTWEGKPLETAQVKPENSNENLSRDHVKEIVKSLCEMAKNNGKPCLKGVLIKCLKECTELTSEEKEVTKQFIKNLPNGEVNL